MHTKFGKQYDEIGAVVGYSKQHVSNLIAMTRLFDEELVRQNPELKHALCTISEHHARLLARIEDPRGRENALRLVISESMSVRDLQRTIEKLGGWFGGVRTMPGEADVATEGNGGDADLVQIRKVLTSEYELPYSGDFRSFSDFHEFNDHFSIFSAFSSEKLLKGEAGFRHEKKWFYFIAPKLKTSIHHVRIQAFGDFALATMSVDYKGTAGGKRISLTAFGSIVFIKKKSWRIVHEHWSRMLPSNSLAANRSMPGHTFRSKVAKLE
jgi:SnoaL-like domain/HTH domain found in ParB protein